MKRKAVDKWLNKNLIRIVSQYGLNHVDLEVTTSEDSVTNLGECTTDFNQNTATIVLYVSDIEDMEDLEETLRHELEHVLLAPWDMFFDITLRLCPDSTTKAIIYSIWHTAQEISRANIGRFRQNILASRL